jgi:hypothetical protein
MCVLQMCIANLLEMCIKDVLQLLLTESKPTVLGFSQVAFYDINFLFTVSTFDYRDLRLEVSCVTNLSLTYSWRLNVDWKPAWNVVIEL